MIKITFEAETQYGTYRDALYFPEDQPLPPQEVIEEMKLERVTSWVYNIENPIILPEPEPLPEPNPEPGIIDG
jgi:hypothetical protein